MLAACSMPSRSRLWIPLPKKAGGGERKAPAGAICSREIPLLGENQKCGLTFVAQPMAVDFSTLSTSRGFGGFSYIV